MLEQSPELIELMSLQNDYDVARNQYAVAKAAAKEYKEQMDRKVAQITQMLRQLKEPNLFRKAEGEV